MDQVLGVTIVAVARIRQEERVRENEAAREGKESLPETG
jgi:hypothetical protein